MQDQSAIDALKEYLAANQQYWAAVSPTQSTDQAIILDLLVGHPAYLIGICTIAKYLQLRFNHRLIGLVRSPDSAGEMAVAQSFGVDGFIYYNTEINANLDLDYQSLFGNKTLAQQRRTLIDLTINDLHLGDLAYDSYLRNTGMGTVEAIDGLLLTYVKQTVRDYIFFQNIINQHNIVASVQGHMVYSPYGTLARTLAAKGGTVYARKYASGPMTVRRYHGSDSIEKYEFSITPKELDRVLGDDPAAAAEQGMAIMKRRLNNQRLAGDGTEAYRQDKKHYSREELTEQLGLDPTKPLICIMSHVLPDAPHFERRFLFDDYVQWIRATLEAISGMRHANWLIKPHPDDRHFNSQHSAVNESAAYVAAHDHIALAPDDLHSACLFDMVDGVVTGNGTAGMEFAAMGIPCVTAGDSFYTGLGFTIEPQTAAEYHERLNDLPAHGPLDGGTAQRALGYVYYYYQLGRVPCGLVPDAPDVFWLKRDETEVWKEAAELARRFDHQHDPLYRNLNRQLDLDADHILRFDQLEPSPAG